jgi:hypothetical protein
MKDRWTRLTQIWLRTPTIHTFIWYLWHIFPFQGSQLFFVRNLYVFDCLEDFRGAPLSVQINVKCWILLKPVLGGVDGSLHLTEPSMNNLNQTEPATFSILPCWPFFRDSYFLYFLNRIHSDLKYMNNSLQL